MEVKPGYKQTEVGVIPEDWETVSLSALLGQGPTNGWSGRSTNDTTGTPTLSLSATTSGRLVLNEETVKYLEARIPSRSDLYLAPGDVLVQRSNTVELVGTTAVFDGPAGEFVYPDLMMRLRFKQPTTGQWFWRYANSASGRSYFRSIAAGSTGSMPKISGAKLREMPVPMPTRAEQDAIVEALRDADTLIKSLEQLLTKARRLKQGAIEELLAGKRRLPGFSRNWDVPSLGELFTFKNGLNKAKEFFGFGTPIVNYMDVYGYRGVTAHDLRGRVFVSKDELRAFEVRKGDVFFTRTSETAEEVGITSVMLDDSPNTVFSGFVLRARPKDDSLDDNFKKYCFSTRAVREQITSQSTETTRALTNGRSLASVRINRPPTLEQAAIAEVLGAMDAEIASLEAKLAKIDQIKQGMMQELLTGKIRLL